MLKRTKALKRIALFMAFAILNQVIFPTFAMALTGGPSQPETQGFTPVGTSDMVDLFSGDFQYNIPLMDVDGYPLNLAYQSNPSVEAEASWVGLGWSLNPGVISRQMRGYPDDFRGETITKEYNIKNDVTVGVGAGPGVEVFGMFGIGVRGGIFYNNYRGFGTDFSVSPSLGFAKANAKLTASLGFSSQGGLDVSAGVGLSTKMLKETKLSASASFNSRRGLKSLTIDATNKEIESKLLKGIRLGGAFSFGGFSYTPTSPMPLSNASFSFHANIGAEAFGAEPNVMVNGYTTTQFLRVKKERQPAYGTLYLAEGRQSDRNLLDFNWNRKEVYRSDIPNIPYAYGTYDIFSATGQGVMGQFKASRNDVGTFRDAYHSNLSVSVNGGAELAVGNLFHAGTDINIGTSNTTTKLWEDDNETIDNLSFTENEGVYESVFFKSSGEKTISDPNFYNKVGGASPIQAQLSKRGAKVKAKTTFDKSTNQIKNGTVNFNQLLKKDNREKRNQIFSYLTADEATFAALDKQIKNYTPLADNDLFNCSDFNPIERTNHGKDHHISEVTITQGDGSRYIYGIPAYNREHKEVTFSIAPNAPQIAAAHNQTNPNFGLVSYAPGSDNSTNNSEGDDQYFESKNIPEYAHSYLLTAVVSPDYVDLTGDGITNDDTGSAVQLNYSKVEDDYGWRMPYQAGMARYQEGYKSETGDDKASYLYGKKEMWYLHSIESRTMVAQFILENRSDALGVSNEDGAKDTGRRMKALKRIDLYSKADLNDNDGVATPIKSVHFTYDYTLCPGIPNATDGQDAKLTLKRIHFTYGMSQRGTLNAYKFAYKNENSIYRTGYMDRWGNYKINPNDLPDNTDFPYALQDKTLADNYAGTWSLNKIDLPSGGQINIEYESDDYGYVQNKRAGQMMFIAGFADNGGATTAPSDELYVKESGIGNYTINKYMFVDLPQEVTDISEMKKRYLAGMDKIYFHCLTNMDGNSNRNDYVKGYVEYDKANVDYRLYQGQPQMIIPLKPFVARGKEVHPIAKSAFQNMRLYMPQFYYAGYETNGIGEAAIKSLVGFAGDLKSIFSGPERYAMGKGFGKTVDTANRKSWVRLYSPNYTKLGGGSRVKQLTVSDEWNFGNGASSYGQDYDYTTTLSINGNEETISSGVASYEPALGGEENMMRQPLPYKQDILLAPDNHFYTETPVGEELFPGASVGYSKVRVSNIAHTDVKRTATGYSVNEFYTAKDFPTITDFTTKNEKRVRANPLLKFFKIKANEHLSVSQGYTVEVNDMHGKPKIESVFNEESALISSSKYFYNVDNENASRLHLNNTVEVVQPNGTITSQEIGVDTDIWHGVQQEINETEGVGIAANVDGFLAFIFPIVVPVPIPIYQSEKTRFRSMATTKLVKRYGLLDRVMVTENGSTLTTYNKLYDSETGNVLLTETQNEFDDPVYQFGYPAHWAYDGMEQAYQNIHAVFDNVTVDSDGKLSGLDIAHLTPGDEVVITVIDADDIDSPISIKQKFYVALPANNKKVLLTMEGTALRNGMTNGEITDIPTNIQEIKGKIIRSGHRNQAAAGIGSIMSLQPPTNTLGNQLQIDNNTQVLQANANIFDENWKMLCNEMVDECGNPYLVEEKVNPYVTGLLGNWRPESAYTFYSERSPAMLTSTNIRQDGIITNFEPFWNLSGGQWNAPSPSNLFNSEWTLSNRITMYDHRGNEVENQDAIGNFSTASYGYNNNRVVAIASNAEKEEVAFDGLEDYNFISDCDFSPHHKNFLFFDFAQADTDYTISNTVSHTGKHSIKLGAKKQVTIKNTVRPCRTSQGDLVPYSNHQAGNSITSTATTAKASFGNFTTDRTEFMNTCRGCIPKLYLKIGKEYYSSLWVASDKSLDCNAAPVAASFNIGFDTPDIPVSYTAVGPTIDGWQRIEARFSVPSEATKIILNISNDSDEAVYYDDIRIHPWESYLNAYVYDPNSLRLFAELDENNYASFYEYDDEGILVRVKRETEAGIVTIQEARTVLKPNTMD